MTHTQQCVECKNQRRCLTGSQRHVYGSMNAQNKGADRQMRDLTTAETSRVFLPPSASRPSCHPLESDPGPQSHLWCHLGSVGVNYCLHHKSQVIIYHASVFCPVVSGGTFLLEASKTMQGWAKVGVCATQFILILLITALFSIQL